MRALFSESTKAKSQTTHRSPGKPFHVVCSSTSEPSGRHEKVMAKAGMTIMLRVQSGTVPLDLPSTFLPYTSVRYDRYTAAVEDASLWVSDSENDGHGVNDRLRIQAGDTTGTIRNERDRLGVSDRLSLIGRESR